MFSRHIPGLLSLCFVLSFGPRIQSQPVVTPQHDPAAAYGRPVDRAGDLLPEGALHRFGTQLFRHSEEITDSCLSPDGKLFAAIANSTVGIWDVATGVRVQLLRDFPDCGIPGGTIGNRLAFSSDGKMLAHSAIYNFGAFVWNVADGKLISNVGRRPSKLQVGINPPAFGSLGPSYDDNPSLRFSADGKQLLILGAYGIARFDSHSGKRLEQTEVQIEFPFFSPDGKLFAGFLSGPPQTFVLHETATGKEVTHFPIEASALNAMGSHLSFAPDAKRLAIADGGPSLRILEAPLGKQMLEFKLPKDEQKPGGLIGFTRVQFSLDGKTLFAGTWAGEIRRYDLVSGKELSALIGHRDWVTGLNTTPDGTRLLSTSGDATIRRWDLATGKEIPSPAGYLARVSAARSADGKVVAVADPSGRLELWDAIGGKLERNVPTSGQAITCLAFSASGKLLAVGSEGGVIRLLEPSTGNEHGSLNFPAESRQGPDGRPVHLEFSRDESRLVAVSEQNRLHFWNVATKELLWSTLLSQQISRVVFSPDGKTFASATGQSNSVTYLATYSGKVQSTASPALTPARPAANPRVRTGPVPHFISAMCFAPDGNTLATAHYDGLIRLWLSRDEKELATLDGKGIHIRALRFSHDGKWLASGDSDGMVRIWEVASGKEAFKLAGHTARIDGLDFGADDTTILSSGGTEVLIWNMRPTDTASSDMATLWSDLASSDVERAYAAVWGLATVPREAADFLRTRLAAVDPEETQQRLPKLIAELDKDRNAGSDVAFRNLAELGWRARDALLMASRHPPSARAGVRIRELLDRLGPHLTPDELRRTRAIQVLELAGTTEWRQLLLGLAGGATGARLTDDAKQALVRLAEKKPISP